MTPARSRRIAYWQAEHARSRSEAEVRYQAWACVMWWRGTGAKSPRGIAGF
ncbi:MAG TPA: hypothetical protein VNL98_06730 [Gemmatimonadales bacterium]|nr:hypothetical protein [Gemmatimonadales bacterium]